MRDEDEQARRFHWFCYGTYVAWRIRFSERGRDLIARKKRVMLRKLGALR